MSGSSYDYAYEKIERLAVEIKPTTSLRKAFKTHLHKVAKACHEIEWVDSGDSAPGDENNDIRACLGNDSSSLVLTEVIAEAERVRKELEIIISELKNKC